MTHTKKTFTAMEDQLRKRVLEMKIANDELVFQNEEKNNQIAELFAAKEIAEKKAEESEKLKTAFLMNISHEIRTPINIILGFSEILAERNVNTTKIMEYAYLIRSNSIRLMNLLDDIIDLSKLQVGQKKIVNSNFSINKLMDKLLSEYIKDAKRKSIPLIVHQGIENNLDIIYSCEQIIYQIFNNLISNSLKYTHSGRIDFGYHVEVDKIELFVKDTGIGISKEYAKKLFTKFSQENASLSRPFAGAGLGLSLVKGLVDLLGGTVRCISEKEKGTAFRISFALKQDQDEPSRQETTITHQEPYDNKDITLLIVEDDEITFYLLQLQILQEFPCKILHAGDGYIAIEKVKAHPEITCVLMDMHLPGIDGCETTKRIKRLKKELPIFAVTAAVMDFNQEKALHSGCNNFFSKPVDRERLYQLIVKCANQ